MPNPLVAIGGSSVLGAAAAIKGSSDARKSASSDLELRSRIHEDQIQRLDPFTDTGTRALDALQFLHGLGERPEGFDGLSLTPAAQFRMTEGRDAIEAGAAGRGNLFSGATASGLERLRTDLATQDRDSQIRNLFALTQIGQSSAAGQNAASNSFGAGATQASQNAANASMAGTIGAANAINSGVNNYLGYQAFQRLAQ